MKLITFVVPCFNSEKDMRRCIDSLLVAGKSAEIIIVNDGSMDGTGSIADKYADRYPDIVRVLHQEVTGRGDSINQGVRHARGKYIKIVDPSDRLDTKALKAVVKKLKRLEHAGGIDLMVCSCVLEHDAEGAEDKVIGYGNVFDTGRVLHWRGTRPFLFAQILMLQACIFRTAVCRKSGVKLHKHIYNEDNLFVFGQLPRCRRIYYLPLPLHRIAVREGSTLTEDDLSQLLRQQLMASEEIFKMYSISEIRKKNSRLGRYMYHQIMVMMLMSTVLTHMNKTDSAEDELKSIWEDLKKEDSSMAFRLRYLSPVALFNLPGSFGRKISSHCYNFVTDVVRFS